MAGAPIGFFDSGIGGTTVLREVRALLPREPLLYLADQARCPYGGQPEEVLRRFASECTRWLVAQGAKLVVVACNTASAAALETLRTEFSDTPFVGMVPALKPAVLETKTGVVGVLATPTTMQGKLLRDVMARWRAEDVRVVEQVGAGLVELVEAGEWDSPKARALLREHLVTMVELGADRVVLGCTHYPYLADIIREIAPSLEIVDAAPAVARQVQRVLETRGLATTDEQAGPIRYVTTGAAERFAPLLARLGVPEGTVDGQPVSLTSDESPARRPWYPAAHHRRRHS